MGPTPRASDLKVVYYLLHLTLSMMWSRTSTIRFPESCCKCGSGFVTSYEQEYILFCVPRIISSPPLSLNLLASLFLCQSSVFHRKSFFAEFQTKRKEKEKKRKAFREICCIELANEGLVLFSEALKDIGMNGKFTLC
ncbi:hypothetical protein VNO80_24700 [Phaseolus coccineus]|uniref:Uncharacterized protein n=1 Tax=Phaseolus coccineus TaxID=3886 RepID=A0AAN9LTE7_PHACN